MPLPPLVSLAQPQIRALVSRVPMPSENLAGRTIAGYRLLERVGEGGTAEVYRAEHPDRGPCAFKVLRSRLASDPTVVKRFLREAGYGARVHHPGVVRTYDFGEADGLYYLALEWAPGKSLADYVHRVGPLAPPVVDRKSTRLNSSHSQISYAVFCLKKKKTRTLPPVIPPTHTRRCPRRSDHSRIRHSRS